MNAAAPLDVRRQYTRRRRVVLVPLGWCVEPAVNVDLQATVTNKVMDTGESTIISRRAVAQGMPVRWLDL
jgi:hypothetical protein